MRALATTVLFLPAVLAMAAPQVQPQQRRGGVVGGVGSRSPQSVSQGKRAADWTLDERLARRCDRQLAASRVRELHARTQSTTTRPLFVSRAVDVISGRTNPELFLPHELFETVVNGTAFDAGWRLVYKPLVKEAGLPPDFWARLESISGAYIADLREQRAAAADRSPAGRALAASRAAALESRTCRDRALALAVARTAFGPAFDRFLYDFVAPNRTDYLDSVSDAEVLRSRERGCQ